MEIERINENTVKLYISYMDIEERGFDREEIWYNRERSEELFWEMMDEIHEEDEFLNEGPLWIQIQALDKGLEVIVTKAQLSKDGQKLELPIPDEKNNEIPVDHAIEDLLDQNFQVNHYGKSKLIFEFVFEFKDFEDILSLSKNKNLDEQINTQLFSWKDVYYLHVHFPDEQFDDKKIDNALSILLEYGQESNVTVHRLVEYGNKIIEKDVFSTLNQYFE
ncbi:adapter protein MecA 1 [Bacillus sp. J14TS2]|uniref:adaptor protein MecA n=1 Tax=unclassified Bacillus (in: firmicutes) TaxID=185979 RepID=UPI001A96DE3C|nr:MULTISPECIES: adaptor protein MecA [unclassified Bacillus (in: firmicutes)]MBO0993670.1 adaptor protein MecA [Bacillus sp. SD088]GIN74091.1 adapter protein MecA 1 [Bacillus sp. J14TS2]